MKKKIQESVGKNSVILTRSESNMAFKKAGIKIVVLKIILWKGKQKGCKR